MKKRTRKPLTPEQKKRKIELQLIRRRVAGQKPMTAEEHGSRLNEAKEKWIAQHPSERVRVCEANRCAANGKGQEHELALCWSLRAPDGRVYQFKNLVHFVRTNRHLFSEYELEERKYGKNLDVPRIVRLLIGLSPRNKHPRETARGWRWHIEGSEPESYFGASPTA